MFTDEEVHEILEEIYLALELFDNREQAVRLLETHLSELECRNV